MDTKLISQVKEIMEGAGIPFHSTGSVCESIHFFVPISQRERETIIASHRPHHVSNLRERIVSFIEYTNSAGIYYYVVSHVKGDFRGYRCRHTENTLFGNLFIDGLDAVETAKKFIELYEKTYR